VRTLLVAVLLAGGIELVQWALPYRSGQWADIAIGVAGAGTGVAVSIFIAHWQRDRAVSAAPSAPGRDEIV
jgi:VanZ family protein